MFNAMPNWLLKSNNSGSFSIKYYSITELNSRRRSLITKLN